MVRTRKKKKQRLEWRVKKKPEPSVPWTELPRDVTENILNRLGTIDKLESAQKVCTTWRSVFKEPHMWRVIDMKNYNGHQVFIPPELETMCRRAVDRSQGQLLDFSIENFGSDDLLNYISERSSQLKRLRLASCPTINGQGLSKAVEKFPQLSELHLFFIPMIFGRDIEAIGRACPLLKAFSLNNRAYRCPLIKENNEHASAVANNMPGLRHLRLFGNRMTNEGLESILVGCPQLESLDIRQCFNVDLKDKKGDLGKRCVHQIRELRRPTDSVADYEFDARVYDFEDDMYLSVMSDYEYGYDHWSIGDYDDFTNPFSSEYLSDSDAWAFNALSIDAFDVDYFM